MSYPSSTTEINTNEKKCRGADVTKYGLSPNVGTEGNRHIADIIGPDLVERKQAQQFLVTSHNANLVVLTDADLIVHVDSDGATASFPRSGFLAASTSRVRGSVLDVLDGGEAALEARQRKYGTAVAGGE